MMKVSNNKKQKQEHKVEKNSISICFSAVTNESRLKLLKSSLDKINAENLKNLSVYLPVTDMDFVAKDLSLRQLQSNNILFPVKVNKLDARNEIFKKVCSMQASDFVIWIDNAELEKEISLNEILSFDARKIEEKQLVVPVFYTGENRVSAQKAFFIMTEDWARYLSSVITVGKNALYDECLYFAKKLNISLMTLKMKQANPFVADETTKKRFFSLGLDKKILLLFKWFFVIPLQEFKEKTPKKFSFIKENSIFRFVFASLTVLLLFLMPILSLKSGISGDEHTQYVHSKDVVNYYKTFGKDTTALENNKTFMHLYGASFDIITGIVNDVLKIDNYYESRHIMNALVGWLLIIFTALLVYLIAGWRGALITLLLMLFSPRILGHSWNNPKDIPFAAACVMSIYYMIRFIQQLPKPKFFICTMLAISIGFSISIRVGGFLMIAYFGFFVFLFYLFYGFFHKRYLSKLGNVIVFGVLIVAVGYVLGLLLWPFALQNPIKNPIFALKYMSNFGTGIRQIFDGEFIWSNKVTPNYLPTYLFYTTPVVVLIGIVLFVFTLNKTKIVQHYESQKHRKVLAYLFSFIILFSAIFPVFYVIYKDSNLYGAMRHVLFAYPMMVAAAGIGFEQIFRMIKKEKILMIVYVVFIGLFFHPVKHTLVNHPYQYVYYNEILGGVKNAFGRFETDYYYHSLKEGSEWLIDEIKQNYNETDTVYVASNHSSSVRYYFKDQKNVIVRYIRYYHRGDVDWDYAVVANSYISPQQQAKGMFPPANTIHKVKVDNIPICAVIERTTKEDYEAFLLMKEKKYPQAILMYNKALEKDQNNESALLNLAQCYVYAGMYQDAIKISEKCLKVYPKYDKALNWRGIAEMRMNQLDKALGTFNRIIKINYRFVNAYYFSGVIYANQGLNESALHRLVEGMTVNLNFDGLYVSTAEVIASYHQKNDLTTPFQLIVKDLDKAQINVDPEKDKELKNAILYKIANALQQKGMQNVGGQLLGYAQTKGYIQ